MKKILVMASMVMLGTSGAWALGTEAGTDITNSATLSYSAGGVAQPDVTTQTPDTFKVDKKVDMLLTTTDTDQIVVTPGQTDRITSYQFINEGNADQKFTFAVSNLNNNEEADYDTDKDNADTDSMRIEYSTDGGTTWQAYSSAITVPKDTTVDFRVKSNIKTAANGAADGDIMNIELVATAVKDDGTTPESESASDDPAVVDVVLADGVNDGTLGSHDSGKGDADKDGKEAARSGYIIQTPVLALTKTSCPVADPVNGTTNPKRIPGAIIRYVLDVKNTGSSNASGITLTDTIQNTTAMDYSSIATNTTYNNLHTNTGDTPCGCAVDQPSGGTEGSVSNSGSNPEVKFENITVAAPTAPATENHTCVSFDITIN